jgi:hypothetical protein
MNRILLTVALGLAVVATAPATFAAAPELKDCKTAADAEKKACLQGNIKALRKSLAAAINQKCKSDAAKAGQKDDALALATLTCTETKLQELYKGASQ